MKFYTAYTACCYHSFIVFANDARQYEKLVIFNPPHAAFLYSTLLPLYYTLKRQWQQKSSAILVC